MECAGVQNYLADAILIFVHTLEPERWIYRYNMKNKVTVPIEITKPNDNAFLLLNVRNIHRFENQIEINNEKIANDD